MSSRTSAFVAGTLLFMGVGCSNSADTAPAIACGEGTTLDGSTCVATAADVGVAIDTSPVDGSMVSCGPGTVLDGGQCVVAPPGDGPTFAGLDSVTALSPTSVRLSWAAATSAAT
jgi:hypothetical protein